MEITMPTVNQIIALAQSQVGTTEYPPNSNNVIYNTAYYGHDVQDGVPTKNDKYPWCAVFVWWCFSQFTPCLVKKTASCMDMGDWFKANGRWGATPHVGDVVFFKFSTNNRWTNHVGIVKEVLDGGAKIITIEGNTSQSSDDNGGAVMERTRTSNIVGYGRPQYDDIPVGPKDDYSYGIDVSECQGTIEWDKVKNAGITFACIRSTKRNGSMDAQFENNLKGCIENGIDYSCYKYAYANTHEAARIEADEVINLLKDRKMPIWYDMEDNSLADLGKDTIEGIALSFIGECKEAGLEVGIYCNKSWYDNYISDYLKKKYPFWIARYGKNTGQLDEEYKPTGKNVIAWQYTSKGQLPGIIGYVDRDVLY
jgi:GH25 family lysozyme M1 (1,4-beta-N-acetylmuramidase)